MNVGDKVLCVPPWGYAGVTRENALARAHVVTVANVTKAGLITLGNGEKIREDAGRFRRVPQSDTRYEWHPLTPELKTERDAAIRLYRLRQQVGAIKPDTLTEAQCVGILAVLAP